MKQALLPAYPDGRRRDEKDDDEGGACGRFLSGLGQGFPRHSSGLQGSCGRHGVDVIVPCFGGMEAAAFIRRQGLVNPGKEVHGVCLPQGRVTGHLRVAVHHGTLVRRVGNLARKQFVERGAQLVHVAPGADFAPASGVEFRRRVAGSDLDEALVLEGLGAHGAEVDQLGRAVRLDEDVSRLDVAMVNSHGVKVVQDVQQAEQKVRGPCRLHALSGGVHGGHQVEQGLPLDVFHNVIAGAVGIKHVEHLHDAGVVELGQDGSLLPGVGNALGEVDGGLFVPRVDEAGFHVPEGVGVRHAFLDDDVPGMGIVQRQVRNAEASGVQHIQYLSLIHI